MKRSRYRDPLHEAEAPWKTLPEGAAFTPIDALGYGIHVSSFAGGSVWWYLIGPDRKVIGGIRSTPGHLEDAKLEAARIVSTGDWERREWAHNPGDAREAIRYPNPPEPPHRFVAPREDGSSLYDKLKAAGQQLDHHESDLYVKRTPEADAIIRAHGGPEAKNARPFIDNIDGQPWIDIPFAYIPYWERKQGRTQATEARGHHVAIGGRGEIIPYRRWKNRTTGATAGLYGSIPWTGAPGDRKEDWAVETVGWTIRWADGTEGVGRQPFQSEQEAQAWLDSYYSRRPHLRPGEPSRSAHRLPARRTRRTR